jgi:hypothetical protein
MMSSVGRTFVQNLLLHDILSLKRTVPKGHEMTFLLPLVSHILHWDWMPDKSRAIQWYAEDDVILPL